MKLLKQILFTAVVVIGFSLTASAQNKQEEKKKPPKENAEIEPKEKNKPKEEKPKNENPNNENKGKKPQAFFVNNQNRIEISFV